MTLGGLPDMGWYVHAYMLNSHKGFLLFLKIHMQ